MSNVPHRNTTPEEDVQTGKSMVIMWSAILVFCIICLVLEPSYWFVIAIPAIACIFGILAGKDAKERGEQRRAEREKSPITRTKAQTDYNNGGEIGVKSSPTKQEGTSPTKGKRIFKSIPAAVSILLSENPEGLKASKIADITGFQKKDINRYLYSHKNMYSIASYSRTSIAE